MRVQTAEPWQLGKGSDGERAYHKARFERETPLDRMRKRVEAEQAVGSSNGRKSDNDPSKMEPLPFRWARDIRPRTETIDFVEDLLTIGGTSVVWGVSNVGKTFFVLDLAFHVAMGWEWSGKRVEQGAVLYVALEGTVGIDNRISGFMAHNKLADDPLACTTASVNLCESLSDRGRIVATVDQLKQERGPVKLIVVDTLSRAMAGGDENSSVDMGKLIRNVDYLVKETGAHVMLVHHCGKSEASMRGHSLLQGAVNTELELSHVNKTSKIFKMSVEKQRDLEFCQNLGFRLKPISFVDSEGNELKSEKWKKPITTCVVESVDHDQMPAKPSRGRNREDTDREHREAILAAFRLQESLTRNDAKDRSGLNSKAFDPAWGSLLRSDEILEAGEIKKKNGQSYPAFARKYSDPA